MLKVSLLSNKEYDKGKLINMLTSDSSKIKGMCEVFTDMFFLPIKLVIGLFIMYNEIGWSLFFGLGAMLFMSVLNFFIGKSLIKRTKLYMKEKDKRIKFTTEIFNSIKFVKVNAWEEYFYDKLNA